MIAKPDHWTSNPANFRKAIRVLSFEAYHMRLFRRLCKQGLAEYVRIRALAGQERYPRAFCDQAFECSFYVHLRVLLGFFYIAPQYDDVAYVHFEKYFRKPFVPDRLEADDEKAKRLRQNLNKRVAHLSATRFLEPQPQSKDEIKDELQYYLICGEKMHVIVTSFIDNVTLDLQMAFNDRTTQEFEARDVELLRTGNLPKHFTLAV